MVQRLVISATKILAMVWLGMQLTACGGGSAGGEESAGLGGGASPSGAMTVNWVAPAMRGDGDALAMTEIAGYTIYYGTSQGDYSNTHYVDDAYASSTTISNLPAGDYYIVVTARDIEGRESDYSNTTTRTVQ